MSACARVHLLSLESGGGVEEGPLEMMVTHCVNSFIRMVPWHAVHPADRRDDGTLPSPATLSSLPRVQEVGSTSNMANITWMNAVTMQVSLRGSLLSQESTGRVCVCVCACACVQKK